jgi:hypothetical protein
MDSTITKNSNCSYSDYCKTKEECTIALLPGNLPTLACIDAQGPCGVKCNEDKSVCYFERCGPPMTAAKSKSENVKK